MNPWLQVGMFLAGLLAVCAFGWFAIDLLGSFGLKPHESRIIFPVSLGVALIICLSVVLNYVGMPMTWVTVLLMVPIAGGFWRAIRAKIWTQVTREELEVVFFAVLGGGVALIPLLLFQSFNPYNDTFTYICIADYLVDHGFLNDVDKTWGNRAVMSQIELYHNLGFRMGAQYLLSFYTLLFQRSLSVEAYLPVTGLSIFMYIGSSWIFAKYGLSLSAIESRLVVLLLTLHFPLVVGPAMLGFLPQTFGLAFIIIVVSSLILICKKTLPIKAVIVTGLFVAALILTYSEGAPFLFLCGCALLAYFYFQDKKYAGQVLKQYLLVALSGIAFAQYGSFLAVKAILHQMKAITGGDVQYTVWQYWTQLLSIAPPHFGKVSIIMAYPDFYIVMNLVGVAVVLIICKGIANLGERRKVFDYLVVTGAPFVAMILYFALVPANPWQKGITGHTWNIYKVIQFGFFLFPPAMAILWCRVWNISKSWRRISIGVGATALVLMMAVMTMSVYHSHISMKQMTGNATNPIQEYYKLRESVLQSGERTLNIIVPSAQHKHRQMAAYFLREVQLIGNWMDDSYIYPWLTDAEKGRNPDPQFFSLVYNSKTNNMSNKPVFANMFLVKPGIAK